MIDRTYVSTLQDPTKQFPGLCPMKIIRTKISNNPKDRLELRGVLYPFRYERAYDLYQDQSNQLQDSIKAIIRLLHDICCYNALIHYIEPVDRIIEESKSYSFTHHAFLLAVSKKGCCKRTRLIPIMVQRDITTRHVTLLDQLKELSKENPKEEILLKGIFITDPSLSNIPIPIQSDFKLTFTNKNVSYLPQIIMKTNSDGKTQNSRVITKNFKYYSEAEYNHTVIDLLSEIRDDYFQSIFKKIPLHKERMTKEALSKKTVYKSLPDEYTLYDHFSQITHVFFPSISLEIKRRDYETFSHFLLDIGNYFLSGKDTLYDHKIKSRSEKYFFNSNDFRENTKVGTFLSNHVFEIGWNYRIAKAFTKYDLTYIKGFVIPIASAKDTKGSIEIDNQEILENKEEEQKLHRGIERYLNIVMLTYQLWHHIHLIEESQMENSIVPAIFYGDHIRITNTSSKMRRIINQILQNDLYRSFVVLLISGQKQVYYQPFYALLEEIIINNEIKSFDIQSRSIEELKPLAPMGEEWYTFTGWKGSAINNEDYDVSQYWDYFTLSWYLWEKYGSVTDTAINLNENPNDEQSINTAV